MFDSVKQIEKALGKRRMKKVSEVCLEWSGVEVVLADNWFYDVEQTLSYFDYSYYDYDHGMLAKKKIIADMKQFIDAVDFDEKG